MTTTASSSAVVWLLLVALVCAVAVVARDAWAARPRPRHSSRRAPDVHRVDLLVAAGATIGARRHQRPPPPERQRVLLGRSRAVRGAR